MVSWWNSSPGYIYGRTTTFVWVLQYLVYLFQKGHTSLWQFTRIPDTLQIIAERKLADREKLIGLLTTINTCYQ